ncbi:hypothetical protein Q7P37_008001 [Cladosporium fusiforme]
MKEPPLRPHAPKGPEGPDERQSLLSFYQRYSYRERPGDGDIHGNIPPPRGDISRLERAKDYLCTDVSTRWADLVLMVCFMISGLVDSGAYNAYSCFVSMQVRKKPFATLKAMNVSLTPYPQTGNTIFLALGVNSLPMGSPSLAWTKSLTAILSFILGAGLISAFHRTFGERRRWVLAASFAFQMLVTATAATLVTHGRTSESPAKPGEPSTLGLGGGVPEYIGFPTMDLVAIGLLSFQAAGKVVASRVLGLNPLPTVVLTTLYNDLASDPALFTAGLAGNVQRNRRFGGLVLYILGSLVGGAFARSSVGFAGALWFTVGLKILIVGAWLSWREEGKHAERQGSGRV